MLSTFVLKVIAVVSMAIDHTGAVLFPEVTLLRYIGRLAFPIYCFLISEGYVHTRNVPKYLMRLGLFALISELPFNLAFGGELFHFNSCNVFVTLFLGLFALILFDTVVKWEGIPQFASYLLALIPVAAIARTADTLGSDYGKYGVLLIFIFYIFRENRTSAILVFALSTVLKYDILSVSYGVGTMLFESGDRAWYFVETTQLYCLLAAIPIGLYSGKRGYGGCKWLFYAFYPTHLIILWLLSVILP